MKTHIMKKHQKHLSGWVSTLAAFFLLLGTVALSHTAIGGPFDKFKSSFGYVEAGWWDGNGYGYVTGGDDRATESYVVSISNVSYGMYCIANEEWKDFKVQPGASYATLDIDLTKPGWTCDNWGSTPKFISVSCDGKDATLKTSSTGTGSQEYDGGIWTFKETYNDAGGPCSVKLYDAEGNLMNEYQSQWSFWLYQTRQGISKFPPVKP
jgi:hypothetical protein